MTILTYKFALLRKKREETRNREKNLIGDGKIKTRRIKDETENQDSRLVSKCFDYYLNFNNIYKKNNILLSFFNKNTCKVVIFHT